MAKGQSKKPRKTYTKDDAGRKERFRDFANVRVNRALKAIEAVGKLANKRSYGYTEKHVENIKAALENAVDTAMTGFAGGAAPTGFKIE